MEKMNGVEDIFKFCPHKIVKVNYKGKTCPKARSGHRIVADNANLYSFGGFNPTDDRNLPVSHVLFKELWKFNFASRTWTKVKTKGPIPEQVASHTAVLHSHYLLVYGGTGVPFGRTNSNTLNSYDIHTNSWRKIETYGCHPPKMYGQGMVKQDNLLYVVGGTTGMEFALTVHILNLNTRVWEEFHSKNIPEGRYRHEIAVYNNKIYVFGGGTVRETFGLNELSVFDLDTLKWKNVATRVKSTVDNFNPLDLPRERKCHGCIQNGNEVYICGGYDGSQIFSDIWKFDLQTHIWTKFSFNLLLPVYFHSVALSPNGRMLIFGGVTTIEDNIRTNELYEVWLTIPSLKELCWLALTYYCHHLSDLPIDYLHSIGVPNEFLRRLDSPLREAQYLHFLDRHK